MPRGAFFALLPWLQDTCPERFAKCPLRPETSSVAMICPHEWSALCIESVISDGEARLGGESLSSGLVYEQHLRRPWLEPAMGRRRRLRLDTARSAHRDGQGAGARLLRLLPDGRLAVRPGQLRRLAGILPRPRAALAEERPGAAGALARPSDQASRHRADDLDQLLSALSAGPPHRHPRPDVEGPGGMQLRHLHRRAGGAEFRPRYAPRA